MSGDLYLISTDVRIESTDFHVKSKLQQLLDGISAEIVLGF